VNLVQASLEEALRDLWAAGGCLTAESAVPDRAAFHVQQASEKLVKAALVAHGLRPGRTHKIDEVVASLPEDFPLRPRLAALDRFSEYAVIFRYPGERRTPIPAVAEVETWIEEIDALKTDFERWLGERASRKEGGA
jgi:HEPN domain-containing protein